MMAKCCRNVVALFILRRISFLLIKETEVATVQSVEQIEKKFREESSWVVVDEKNNEPTAIASSSNQSMKRSKDLKLNNIKKIKTIDD
jgi:hypothetical protein